MKRRTRAARESSAPKHWEWFEQKVAELKAALDKLPQNRQEQLKRELEDGPEEAEG